MSLEPNKSEPKVKVDESSPQGDEGLFRQFVESSSDVFWRASLADDKVLYASPSFEKVWGISLESLQYSRTEWLKTVLPEDRERVGKYYGITAKFAPPTENIEFRIRLPDSSIRWISGDVFAVKDTKGEFFQAGGTARDITFNKMSELRINIRHEMSRAFELYNSLEEVTPKIIEIFCKHLGWQIGIFWKVNHTTNVATFFAAWHQGGNKSLEDFESTCSPMQYNAEAGIVGKILNKREVAVLKNVVDSGNFIETEAARHADLKDVLGFPIYLKGQTYGVMEFFNSSIDGLGAGWLDFLNDIAKEMSLYIERKLVESALITSEERFRSSFEHGAIGVSLVTLEGDFFQVNNALCEMMNFSKEEFTKKNFKELTFKEDLIKEMTYLNQLLAGETTHYQTEKRFTTKNKEILWAFASVSLVRDAQNNPSYFIYEVQDISSRKHTEEKLIHLAYYDILTGLPNKKLIEFNLAQTLVTSFLLNDKTAIFFTSVNFKFIDDTTSADISDRILKQVALRLTDRIQIKDIVGRWDTGEFIVVLANVRSLEAVALFAQKLLAIIKDPLIIDDKKFFVTASIGISIFPDDANQSPTLFKNARMAMNYAKKDGMDNFQFYTETMLKQAQEKNLIENHLHRSLSKNELFLNFQPIVDIDSRKTVEVEVLLRWNCKELGLVPPSKFIPIAEESDLILKIGEWTLREVFKTAKILEGEQYPNFLFSVNISALQLKEKNFITLVKQLLKEYDLDPKHLQFEIVESQLLENIKESIDTISALKELNIQFAIDDFGVGYSSFSYLRHFKFDRFKIDISFIRNIDKDPKNTSIVAGIIGMCEALGIPTIAEGVETKEEFELLKKIGCREVQGYYISYPLAYDPFKEYMLKQKEEIAIKI